MTRSNRLAPWVVHLVCLGLAACSPAVVNSDSDQTDEDGEGGSGTRGEQAGGGSRNKGGSGGVSNTASGSAGKTSSKGGSGGASESNDGVGGSTEKGGSGSTEKGGSKATGGSASPDAGKSDAGPGAGGAKSTDASAGAGGSKAVGGGGGGAGKESGGVGGSTGPTPCSFPASWNPGSATYTTYSFSQGTAQSNGKYQTACGYQGTNSGGDTVTNIANSKNFAAIPGKSSSDFDTRDRCGACVEIGSAIVTIIDECPYDNGNQPCKSNPSGHLDLSNAAASSAGVQGDPNVHGQKGWKFVPCPINGNVVVRLKKGNDNEIYIENTILPLASVKCDSETASRTSYGAWHFESNLDGCLMTLTDVAGRTIQVKAGESQDQNVDTGVQFPKCQ